MTVNGMAGDEASEGERVIVYIDGFNFYHGIMSKRWGQFRWLDYRALVERILRRDQELVEAKYFTTKVTHQPVALHRQDTYLNALEQQGGLTMVLGEFEMREIMCRKCGGWYKRPQEKRTDVNIAVHLVADACHDRMDTVYLICADSDLVPAAAFAQSMGKRVVLYDPPGRHSDDLAKIADHHRHVDKSNLSKCLLPNPVEWTTRKGKQRRIHMPDHWVKET